VNVPACENVCEALWPFLSTPVSKLPLLAVAECGLGPSFVHVIESPTCTVIVAGANLKSEITSPGSPATWARTVARPSVAASDPVAAEFRARRA
jgi:hypothetical protein